MHVRSLALLGDLKTNRSSQKLRLYLTRPFILQPYVLYHGKCENLVDQASLGARTNTTASARAYLRAKGGRGIQAALDAVSKNGSPLFLSILALTRIQTLSFKIVSRFIDYLSSVAKTMSNSYSLSVV